MSTSLSGASLGAPSASFADLGVPADLDAALERQGITTPFPIQAACLPDALAGRDVSGKAPTGAGKTLAFGLAVLARLRGAPPGTKGRRDPSALVLVPTRELAKQIEDVLVPLAAPSRATVLSVYGGVGYDAQLKGLRAGVDVLVACPGRLTDLVERGSVRLGHVEMVVIDEADRMADMGFLPVVRSLVSSTSSSRQTLLFSATLDGPVDKLVRDYQHDPVRHEVAPTQADRGEISHHFWKVERDDRVAVTTEVLRASGPAIVFCRTKHGADRLSGRLSRSGLASAVIHGDRSQSQRERSLAAFRAGQLDVLVATDVAARGIHVDAVPLVVHYDPPADATDYVHRSGRTGRAGAAGSVVSLIGIEQVPAVKVIQRSLGLARGVTPPEVSALAVRDMERHPRPSASNGASGGSARGGASGGGAPEHRAPRPPSRNRAASARRRGAPSRRAESNERGARPVHSSRGRPSRQRGGRA